MKISEAFPSKYLRSTDIPPGRELRLTMDRVQFEEMQQTDDEKPVLYFVNQDRGLVLNKTNASTIAAAYGEEMDDWHGKGIILFAATTSFAGRIVPCLRVRAVDETPTDKETVAAELQEAADDTF